MALTSTSKAKLSTAGTQKLSSLVVPDSSWIGTFPVKKTTPTAVVKTPTVVAKPVATPTVGSTGYYTAQGKTLDEANALKNQYALDKKNLTNPWVPSQNGSTPTPSFTDYPSTGNGQPADQYWFKYNADGSIDTVGMGLESSQAYDARQQYAKFLTESANYDSGYDVEGKYNALLDSEWVNAKRGELDTIDKDVTSQKNAISAIENRAREWYGALTADQNARLIDAEASPSRQVLAQKLLEQQTAGEAYNRAKASADTKLNLYTAQQTYKDQQITRKATLLKDRISALDISQTQKDLLMKKLEAKMQDYKETTTYARTNGDINSTDPIARNKAITNAVSQVTSQYKSYPWFIQRPDNVIADAIETGLASGKYKNLQDAIQQELITPIQGKAGYQDILNSSINKNDGFQTFSVKNADGSETAYVMDKKTGQFNQVAGGGSNTGTITKPVSTQSTQFLQMPIDSQGGQCGYYANRAVGLNGEPWGDDTLAGRMKTYTDRTPAVGGLVFFSGGKYDQKNGHVSVVTAVNADGSITVKESNLKWDEKVSTRTIPASEATGFYNNTPLAQANKSTATQKPLSSDASKLYGYTSTGLRNVEAVQSLIDKMGAREFIVRYKAGDPSVKPFVDDLADTVGRIRSGGAVNSEEATRFVERFVSGLNLLWDNSGSIKQMLWSTRQEFLDTQTKMGIDTSGYTATPTSSTPAPASPAMDRNTITANLKAKGYTDAQIQAYLTKKGL